MTEKYYKLEDLKVGMRVSIRSLSNIIGVRVCLDRKTMEHIGGDTFGDIVFIGNDDYTKAGLKMEDICVIKNYNDFSGLSLLEDE